MSEFKELLSIQPNAAELRVMAIINSINITNNVLKDSYNSGIKLLWETEGDVGPEEVLEVLGNKASKIFKLSSMLYEFIKSIDPDVELDIPPYNFIINEDGTVYIEK